MEHRYFKYTALVERNEVYEKYGVTDIEGLKKLAAQIYDPVAGERARIHLPDLRIVCKGTGEQPSVRRNAEDRIGFRAQNLQPFERWNTRPSEALRSCRLLYQ